ncbi:repeat protein [Umbribacter vaginalis]|nr:repeat protein [Coriobacteriales bacterium DNF00809]
MIKIVIKGCEVMGKVIQSFIAVFVFCVLVISPLCTPLANARINALPDAIQNHSYNWNKTVKYDRSGLRPPTVSDADKAALASHNLKFEATSFGEDLYNKYPNHITPTGQELRPGTYEGYTVTIGTIDDSGASNPGTFTFTITLKDGVGNKNSFKFQLTTLPSHKVSFDVNGGSPAPKVQYVADGKKADVPTNPTLANNTFEGWYNGDAKYDFETPVKAPVSLKARWKQAGILINAMPKLEVTNKTITQGDAFDVKSMITTASDKIDGANLKDQVAITYPNGYDLNKAGTYQLGFALTNSKGAKVSKSATLTVIAKKQTYKISFCPNGGTIDGSTTTKEIDTNESGKLTAPVAVRDGYTFEGWSTNQNAQTGELSAADIAAKTFTENTTYYAIWKATDDHQTPGGGGIPTPNPDGGTTPGTGGDGGDGGAGDGGAGSGDTSTSHNKVCITFDFNGGVIGADCGPKTITVEKGALITLLEAPYKQGHTFLYWDESRYQPGDTYKVESDHTFTAVYAPDNAGHISKPESPVHGGNALPSTGDAFDSTIVALVALISGTLTCAYVGGCALYQKRNRY